MLVLSRKLGEKIRISDNITLVVLEVTRGKIKLGVAAPQDAIIRRGEVQALLNAPKVDQPAPSQ